MLEKSVLLWCSYTPRGKARTNSKLNPHETASTGIEPGSQRWDWGERLSMTPPVLSIREGEMDYEMISNYSRNFICIFCPESLYRVSSFFGRI